MYKCSKCSGEFKSNAGLAKHVKSCKYESQIEELQEEVVSNVVPEHSDNIKRMIAKLKDAAKSCQDAEHRYRLEQEWKHLEKSK